MVRSWSWWSRLKKAWERPFVCESDDGLERHPPLSHGRVASVYESGEYPLNHCICGGRQLIQGDEYTVSYVTAAQAKDVAPTLSGITKPWMRQRLRST